MIDIDMIGDLTNAFGPSGFEEEVVKVIGRYLKDMEVENDAMNNVYAWFRNSGAPDTYGTGSGFPGNAGSRRRPAIMLDAHTDECGFMVQGIMDNGLLSMVMLGGWTWPACRPTQSLCGQGAEKGKGDYHIPPRTLHDGKRKECAPGHRRPLY